MTSYRPALKVGGSFRDGTTTATVINRTGPYSKAKDSTAMNLITRNRNSVNQAGPTASLNKLNASTQPQVLPLPISNPLTERLKRENYEDFAARMMRNTDDDELALGPEIHAALISMANGIDPLLGQERKRQLRLRLQQRLEPKDSAVLDGSSHVVSDQVALVENESTMADEPTPFATTFGTGLGRMSLQDLESFQKRNRMWKSALKPTLKYFQHSFNTSQRDSKDLFEPAGSVQAPTIRDTMTKHHYDSLKTDNSSRSAKAKAMADLDRVLQRGSALLMASSALKSRLKVNKLPEGIDATKLVEYCPPTRSFVEKAKDGILKLPIYERIATKRRTVLQQGFPFDTFEDQITFAVRTAARQMKRTIGGTTFTEKPFGETKISALVGNAAVKSQGIRALKEIGPADSMNTLQLKLVQGLEDSELSSFLENHGRRNPEVGMEIIPGRAPDPGNHVKTMKHQRHHTSHQRHSDTLPLEPKFRALPNNVMSRFGEDFGTVRKDEVNVPPPKLSPEVRLYKQPKMQAHGGPRKLSFMDVTKSEFVREMRRHQNQFQKMKSKDEMRKSFPKTYVFPAAPKK